MPRFFYFTPYSPDGLGEAYNQHAALLPGDDDWAVFMDFDAMVFCSQSIESQLQDAIRDYPEYQVFTAMTNRLCARCQQQIQNSPGIREEKNLVNLKKIADARARSYRNRVTPIRGFFAGFFFAFSKKIWKKFPFPTTGSQHGKILGIDSAWSRTLKAGGVKVGLMEGIMVTHFYRLDTGEQDVSHLNDPSHNRRVAEYWKGQRVAQPAAPAEYLNPAKQWYLNPGIRPPGGYRYVDRDGITHFGTSFNDLLRVVAAYRQRIGQPLGNVRAEIMDYYVKRYPRCCIYR